MALPKGDKSIPSWLNCFGEKGILVEMGRCEEEKSGIWRGFWV